MQIDVNNLESQVKPIIRNGRKYIEDAKSFLWGLKIPSDFSYATRLKRIPTDISNVQNEINNIQNWIEKAIDSFKNAENKNKNLINSINASTKTLETNNKKSNIENINSAIQDEVNIEDVNRLVNSTKKLTSNVLNYKENHPIKINDISKATGAKTTYYSVDNNFEAALMTGAFIANGSESKIKARVEDKLGGLGTLISGAWEGLTKIASDIGNVAKRTAASVSNVVIGFGKGVCNFFEGLAKVGCMVQTATLTATTGLFDAVSYTFSAITGNTENWSSLTSEMWKNTMSITSENYVDSAYKSFYEETMIGQWLDENAYEICKSNGILTNISSAIGEIAAAVVLTFVTLGAYPAIGFSSQAVGAFFTGVSKTGNYTSQKWAEARDSSWEGIERMKEKGEISQEQYDSFVTIRQLTNEQWEEVKSDYENGNMTEEMYNQMKQIREMPDDWRTLENGFKGFIYGAANGVWEGIQYYFGAKLGGKSIGGFGRFGSSAIRIGVDTTFNAADTPYRVLVDAMTSDKSLEQAWQDQGGWESVITSVGIGLVASAGGEVIDLKSPKAIKSVDTSKIKIDIDKLDDILNNTNAFKGYDENLAKQLKDAIKQDYIDGKIDLDKILKDGTINHNIAYKLNSFDNITEQIIDVDKIGELPGDFFKNIEHPEKVSFIYKGKKHTYDDLLKNYFKEYSSDVKHGTKNIETNVKNTQKIEQNTQKIEMKDKNANVKQIDMKDKVDVETTNIEANVKNEVDINEVRKNYFDNEIKKANSRKNENIKHIIEVDDLDNIPENVFKEIDNPKNVVFSAKGEEIHWIDAKARSGINKNWQEYRNSPEYKKAVEEFYKEHGLNISTIKDTKINIKDSIKHTGSKKTNTLKTIIEGVPLLTMGAVNKYFKESLSKNITLKNKAVTEGVLHFTSENSVDAIISSGYVKKTGMINSYGKPSSFFFAGKPSVEDIALNIDKIEKKLTAVRIKPTEEIADKFKYRYKDDQALLWNGEFKFKDMGLSAEKAYFILDNVDGKLQYKEVSKEIYNNFDENLLPVKGKLLSSLYSLKVGIDYQMDLVKANIARDVTSIVNKLYKQ